MKQRIPVIEHLIAVGANQRHRDKMGHNMIHSMLRGSQWDAPKLECLQKMLEMFDKDALKAMFLERCTDKPGSLTPLAYWMANNYSNHKSQKVISMLSKYSTGEELSMINGEGDLPLHVVGIPLESRL